MRPSLDKRSFKWKASLIYAISEVIKRPSELQKALPDATKRVLNLQLKQLEEHGIIAKKNYHQLPPKVEYTLTESCRKLIPFIEYLKKWVEYLVSSDRIMSCMNNKHISALLTESVYRKIRAH